MSCKSERAKQTDTAIKFRIFKARKKYIWSSKKTGFGVLLVGWCFFSLRGGFGASCVNELGENSYESFLCDFLLHIKHMHPIQHTSGQILEIPRDALFSSCAGRRLHSPSFSISSQFGEGSGSLPKNIVYLLWTLSLLPRQFSEGHLSHPKLQTQTNGPVEDLLQSKPQSIRDNTVKWK